MMKPQDVVFILLLVFLFAFFRKQPRIIALAGILCLVVSIPLFSFWVFFTAQRLVYYGMAFICLSTCIFLYFLIKNSYNKKQ